MKVDTDNLMSVQKFAQKENVAVQTIYRWINSNLVKAVEIDGVKFIITKSPKNRA